MGIYTNEEVNCRLKSYSNTANKFYVVLYYALIQVTYCILIAYN